MIPSYLLFSHLGLIDIYWALILPTAVSAFNVLIVRNFFMGIDRAITDAARIDGAGEWRGLGPIVLPVSKAVTAVVGLFYGVGFRDRSEEDTTELQSRVQLVCRLL